ncbi:Sorbosone dehydrogenase-domain-containing protein [Tribonema minus]|uniref:Sorbosone dehydrogenase-domain-containing protein n=1 Tax=Tribonema minus TaxID=303371 RepID=A0A835YRR0_9STRA|nr:Sorbosone dehydrogenase-domain-containing protein [Tribonema minus]
MMLCQGFCTQFLNECGASLMMPPDYCNVHSQKPDATYCYPYVPPGKVMPSAFPLLDPQYPGLMNGLQLVPGGQAWWLVNQAGVIWQFPNDPTAAALTKVFDIVEKTLFSGELGLLGLAFHPNFAANGAFYVNYVNLGMATVIARYTYDAADPVATVNSEQVLLTWLQPEANHNGGWLGFSPSDMATPQKAYHDLFIATGDGGGADDNHGLFGNAQDLSSYMGKIMRVRITAAQAVGVAPVYSIPADNPFVGAAPVPGQNVPLPEVYAYGMRNPWRCSFDPQERLWCGDVGQDSVEEINIVEAGENYGWRSYEGTRCNLAALAFPNTGCRQPYTPPVYQYCHADYQLEPKPGQAAYARAACKNQKVMGRSVTGGFVYRGAALAAELGSAYIFADYEDRVLAAIRYDDATATWTEQILADGTNGLGQISTFAEDADGELLLVSYNPPTIQRLVCFSCGAAAAPPPPPVMPVAAAAAPVAATAAPVAATAPPPVPAAVTASSAASSVSSTYTTYTTAAASSTTATSLGGLL